MDASVDSRVRTEEEHLQPLIPNRIIAGDFRDFSDATVRRVELFISMRVPQRVLQTAPRHDQKPGIRVFGDALLWPTFQSASEGIRHRILGGGQIPAPHSKKRNESPAGIAGDSLNHGMGIHQAVERIVVGRLG
jgi:hypothetical protein